MKKLLLFLLSFLLVHNIFSQDVPFTQRLNPNITVKGDITFVANNILNRDSRKTPNLSKRDPNTGLYSAYTGNENANIPYNSDLFRTTNGVSGFPLGNGDLYMDYIDIDDDNSTFSSSKSSLNVPSCSKVIYAGLYWSAIYPYETWDNETPRASDFNNIKFKLPGQSYQDITGEIIYDNGVTTQKPYLCYKDITSDLSALSNPNGDYYAANIKATLGIDANNGVGGTAGWVLVIIYENETESSKNISIFDGFTTVDGVHDTEISLSGFSTIPSGPVRAKILAASLEGDTFITGDNFQIRNNAGNYNNLSTPTVNQSNNFFNSSISKYDNYVTTRTPEGGNTLGFDVDLFELDNVGNTIITNNQTSVDARFTTTGDSYWPFLTAIAIEINEPEIQLVETIDDNSGNNLQFVSLGNDVWYNISFQSTGSDDATNTVITKKLPNNINLIPEDLVIPTGVTYTYDPPSVSNGFRGELEFTIPDNLVKKNGAIYNIRLHTQITSDCNDFKDSCSNIIESQSFVNYEGIQSLIQINNRPSSSGIDACGFNIIGTSNILVDTSSCSSITEVQLCGSSIDLTAGNGFASYEWKDSAGTTIGNTQTITVTTAGTYTVNKINSGTTSAACVPFAETYNVTSSGSGTNPILAFADETLTCTNDTSLQLANFYLCGDSDSRTINTGITAPTILKWQQLNLPSNPTPHSSCPDTNGTWVDVTSNTNNPIRNFSDAGQYRLIVETSGGCFERYYFNIYKETINPTIVNQDIIASTPGSITINNVPSGYEYALVATGAPASITYQTSNVFPISIAGDYDVYIKNASTNCVYQYLSQSIKATDIDVTINTTPILCAGDVGLINVQINNPTSGIYNYRILSGTSLINSFGPTTDRSRDFSITNSGTYTVEITGVDNSYSFIEDIAFSSPQALEITTSTTKEINCTDGVISLSADGGTPSYNYALWSYTPAITATKTPISYVNVADISSSNFFTDANYSITSGEEGIYEFVVVDNNNCTKISSPVTITLEEPLQFTEAHTDVTCSDNGTIIVNTVTPPGLMGYILEYSIDGGVYGNSNSFSVEAGNHIVDIRTTKNGFSCNYSIGPITINSSTVLTGGSVVATNPSCNPSSNVNLGSITFTQPTGGIEPYSYLYKNSSNASFLRTTNTTITDLSSGTYDVQIEDANGCVLILPSVTIDPLPTRPILNSSVLYNCDGTGNITILSNNPNYTYTLENPFTSNNTGIFNNLSSGTYTINIDYGSSCSEEIIVEVLDNQEFSSSIISSSNTSCNGSADGQITITSKNFLTTYDYSIDGGTNWTNTTSTPLTITGLSVGEYTIITRAFDGNNSCEFAVGNVTIEEPETVSISNVNITKEVTCVPNTGATINIIATGGVSPYEFSIDNGNTFQSDPSFTNLTAGTYNLIAKDLNGCISSYFTYIVEPSALVSFTTTGTTCYDGTNGTIDVNVSSGSGGYSFSLNGGAWLFPNPLTATSYTFEGIASGTHTIAVRDNSGCISPSTITTINPELTATATVENNFGLDDVTIIVQGGNPPYEYSTNGGLNYQSINSFTGLTPNSYNLLVRDSTGCISNISTNTECDLFDFRVRLIKEISCIDPDAEVELSILSGSGNYEYEVFDSSGVVIVNRTPITNTTINFPVSFSGTYTVKGYDTGSSSECSLSKDITINPVIMPEFTVSSTNATCNGSATGSIEVSTNAGMPPFSYDLTQLGNPITGIWDASSNSFTNVSAGSYIVRVTGSNGCSTETNITVNENPYLFVPAPSTTSFNCVTANNSNYATISIDTSNITGGSGIYSTIDLYDDNGTPGDLNDDTKSIGSLLNGDIKTFTITNTNGASYYIKVTDSFGCKAFSNSVIIDPFDELKTITITQNDPISCNNGELINIVFDSSLVLSGAIVNIYDSAGTVIETITGVNSGVSVTNTNSLSVGIYTVSITHPITGCELSAIYEVEETQNYFINTNIITNVSCLGSATGEISIEFDDTTPYNGTYSYDLINVASSSSTGITGTGIGIENITGLIAGEYYIEVTMNSLPGCIIRTNNFNIEQPLTALSVYTSNTDVSCHGGNNGEINITANGGWGNYEYQLTNGTTNTVIKSYGLINRFIDLTAGDYIVSVRDVTGCEYYYPVTLTSPENLSISNIDITKEITCNPTFGASIDISVTGGVFPYEFSIDEGNTWQTSNIFTDLSAGTYNITVKDSSDCTVNTCATNFFTNGNFENTPTEISTFQIVDESTLDGWKTTAPDNKIEVWKNGYNGVYSSEGNYFVELNALIPSKLYQEFCTKPGDIISWSLDHRGRLGTDVAEIKIGGSLNSTSSFTETISDENTSWGSYSGVYTVPAGQTTTVISFTAISSSNGNLSLGNFIDNVNIKVNKGPNYETSQIIINASPTIAGIASLTSSNVIEISSVTGGLPPYEYSINNGTSFSSSPIFSNLDNGTYTPLIKDSNGCSVNLSPITINIGLPIANDDTSITGESQTVDIYALNNDKNIPELGTVTVTQGTNGTVDVIVDALPDNPIDDFLRYHPNAGFIGTDTFTYTICDNSSPSNCSTATVTVEVVSNINISLNTINISCAGESNGQVKVITTKGVPPYRYFFRDNAGNIYDNSDSTFSNLPAGIYTVDVFDAINQRVSMETTITEPTAVIATAIVFQDTIEVTATGGIPPYEFSIDNGVTYQSSNLFKNLLSGAYNPLIRDSNNCSIYTGSISITSERTITAVNDNFSAIPITKGDSTPSVIDNDTLNGTPVIVGTNANEVSIIPDPFGTNPSELTMNAYGNITASPNIASGTYTYEYKICENGTNSNNCDTATVTILILNPINAINDNFNPISAGETTNATVIGNDKLDGAPVVSGFNSGEVTINADPLGTNPFGFTFNIEGTITVSPDVPYGDYILKYEICENGANPANCHIAQVTIHVNETSFNLDIIHENVTCFGDSDGEIHIYVNGGTPPYTCKVLDLGGNPLHTETGDNRPFIFSNISAGEYIIEVTDSNNITDTFSSVIVNQPTSPLDESTIVINPTCNGEDNGQIIVTATGGWGGYQYQLDNSSTGVVAVTYSPNNHLTDLKPGNYTLSVKDLNGCTTLSSITIEEPIALAGVADVTSSNSVTISTVIGGQSPYTYSKDGINYQSDNVFNNLNSGLHTFYIRDTNGCTSKPFTATVQSNIIIANDDRFTTNENRPIELGIFSNDDNIPTNGTITVSNPLNGTITSNDNGTPNNISDDIFTYTPNNQFNGTDSFTYIACNSNGDCDTATVTIIVTPSNSYLNILVNTSDSICNGNDNGLIYVNVTGGTEPYNYELLNANGNVIANGTSNVFTNLTSGTYTVKVTDANGSTKTLGNVLINEPSPLSTVSTKTDISCNGADDGSITIDATGGNGSYVYEISTAPGKFQTNNNFTNLRPGNYIITTQDENGCFEITQIEINEADPLFISSIDIKATGKYPSGRIKIGAAGGTPKYQYSINNGPFRRSNKFFDLEAGTYVLTVRDANGCLSAPFTVTIDEIIIDNTVNVIRDILEAFYKKAISYQWINVDLDIRIPGASQATYTPTESGRYQVEMVIEQVATKVFNKTTVRKQSTQVVLSPIIEFNTGTLSTEDIEKDTFSIYPNPATNIINIPAKLLGEHYKVYSIIGNEIYNGKIESTELMIDILSDGIYFLKVDKYTPIKFIKKQ